jgi:shikimate kinase
MKVFLIGFMGVGKTTVGKIVANKLNYKFIDTDSEIESKSKMKISEIFVRLGENHFRKLETNLLNDIIKSENNIIISTGGGMPIFNNNIKLLKENGISIWLKADDKKILSNLQHDKTRPLLNKNKKEEIIKEMLKQRSKMYSMADYTISVDEKNIQQVVNDILGVLKKEVN